MRKALWIFTICLIQGLLSGLLQAEVFRSEDLGIHFVPPGYMKQVDPSELRPPHVEKSVQMVEAILAMGVEDVAENSPSSIVAMYTAEGAGLCVVHYPRHFRFESRPELEEDILSAFALTDYYLGSIYEPGKIVYAPLSFNAMEGGLFSRAFAQGDLSLRTWTAAFEIPRGTLVMRFSALVSSDEVAWPDFHEDVIRCLQSVGLVKTSSSSAGWIVRILFVGGIVLIIYRLALWIREKRAVELEGDYQAELEETFGRVFPATDSAKTLPSLVQSPDNFTFPPRILKALESRDIGGALALARQLLEMAREMKDPHAESTYRECVTRLQGMAEEH